MVPSVEVSMWNFNETFDGDNKGSPLWNIKDLADHFEVRHSTMSAALREKDAPKFKRHCKRLSKARPKPLYDFNEVEKWWKEREEKLIEHHKRNKRERVISRSGISNEVMGEGGEKS
jgi:hypothetical protein